MCTGFPPMYTPAELHLDYVEILRINDHVNLKMYLPQWKSIQNANLTERLSKTHKFILFYFFIIFVKRKKSKLGGNRWKQPMYSFEFPALLFKMVKICIMIWEERFVTVELSSQIDLIIASHESNIQLLVPQRLNLHFCHLFLRVSELSLMQSLWWFILEFVLYTEQLGNLTLALRRTKPSSVSRKDMEISKLEIWAFYRKWAWRQGLEWTQTISTWT